MGINSTRPVWKIPLTGKRNIVNNLSNLKFSGQGLYTQIPAKVSRVTLTVAQGIIGFEHEKGNYLGKTTRQQAQRNNLRLESLVNDNKTRQYSPRIEHR